HGGGAQFDLSLDLVETDLGLRGLLEYNTDLFDAATAARLASHFVTLLESIVADPSQRVGDLRLLPAEERERLLVDWNATRAAYPDTLALHELIAEQAARTPDAVAAAFEDQLL